MADNSCVDYLLTTSDTWESHNTLSSISSYSSTLLCGRNTIKIEPIFDLDDVEDGQNLNMQQEENHFKCEICTTLFNTKDKLIVHKRTHIGEKQCGDLKRHEEIHTGENPYKCKTCDKVFNSSSHLQRHMTTHTGEKASKCKVCDKQFSTNSVLKVHMKEHIPVKKPVKCKVM